MRLYLHMYTWIHVLGLAEDARFELALRFWRKLAFQASGFNHSPNPPFELFFLEKQ